MMKSTTNNERKLRHQKTETNSATKLTFSNLPFNKHRDLYDFDTFITESIPETYKIDIADDKSKLDQGYKLFSTENFEEDLASELSNYSLNLVDLSENENGNSRKRFRREKKAIKPTAFDVRHNHVLDPLNDAIYLNFHKRKEKEERRFCSADKDKARLDFDDCCECLSFLGLDIKKKRLMDADGLTTFDEATHENQEDEGFTEDDMLNISRTLPLITRISNTKDYFELILKYKLTIRELRSFLMRFEVLRLKEMGLKNSITTGSIYEADDEMDVEFNELKQSRLIERSGEVGPIIRIKFYDDLVLIIDPVSKAKIVF